VFQQYENNHRYHISPNIAQLKTTKRENFVREYYFGEGFIETR